MHKLSFVVLLHMLSAFYIDCKSYQSLSTLGNRVKIAGGSANRRRNLLIFITLSFVNVDYWRHDGASGRIIRTAQFVLAELPKFNRTKPPAAAESPSLFSFASFPPATLGSHAIAPPYFSDFGVVTG